MEGLQNVCTNGAIRVNHARHHSWFIFKQFRQRNLSGIHSPCRHSSDPIQGAEPSVAVFVTRSRVLGFDSRPVANSCMRVSLLKLKGTPMIRCVVGLT